MEKKGYDRKSKIVIMIIWGLIKNVVKGLILVIFDYLFCLYVLFYINEYLIKDLIVKMCLYICKI